MTPALKMGLVGLGAGAAAGALVLAVLVPQKIKALQERGAAVQREVEHGGSGDLAQQAAAMRTRLQAFANTYATSLARSSANAYLLSAYGITEARMQRIDQLSARLRPLFGS